jgi:hypothetical protein
MLNKERFSQNLTMATLDSIKKNGVDGSGALNHYKILAEEGRMFGINHIKFTEFVSKNIGISRPIHEIGDGSGIITLALYAQGYNCVNICADRLRSKLSEVLARKVKETEALHGPRYRILLDKFPSNLTNLILSKEPAAVFISYDSVNELFASNEISVIQKTCIYNEVIINLCRFVRKRDKADEQLELLDMFKRRGLYCEHLDGASETCRLVWLKRKF